jgi:lysyl-tRNA synthetase class 2
LKARAETLSAIRRFFRDAGVMEVETAACSTSAASDPALHSLTSHYSGPGAPDGRALYLHTSPEFAMKRLLAAGCGPIYQICKVFRDTESGRFHNPEFTLLEWYRPEYHLFQLMDEVEALVQSLLPNHRRVERISYRDLFRRHLGLDPHRASLETLGQVAVDRGLLGSGPRVLLERDGWLELLLTHCIEPQLTDSGLCFVYDYPASQASLARIRPGKPPLAERFELYLDGVELANGFHELTDAVEQRRRFEQDLQRRRTEGLSLPPMDERFLAALQAGLPDCSGVALGVDRLLMRISEASHINEVLAFPLERA